MNRLTTLTDRPLEVVSAYAAVADPAAGAVDLFIGTTRDNAHGQRVLRLEYEAYEPMALRMMDRLIDEAARRWPLCAAAIIHRTGEVPVEAASVIIAVSAPHRSEAFEACRFLIDKLKQEVPIWKREFYADGTSDWTGAPSVDKEPSRT